MRTRRGRRQGTRHLQDWTRVGFEMPGTLYLDDLQHIEELVGNKGARCSFGWIATFKKAGDLPADDASTLATEVDRRGIREPVSRLQLHLSKGPSVGFIDFSTGEGSDWSPFWFADVYLDSKKDSSYYRYRGEGSKHKERFLPDIVERVTTSAGPYRIRLTTRADWKAARARRWAFMFEHPVTLLVGAMGAVLAGLVLHYVFGIGGS